MVLPSRRLLLLLLSLFGWLKLQQIAWGDFDIAKATLDVLLLVTEDLIRRDLATEVHDLILLTNQTIVLLGMHWHVQRSLLHLLAAQVIQVLVVARVLAGSFEVGGDLDGWLVGVLLFALRFATLGFE